MQIDPYHHADSVLHRLDPRTGLLSTLLLIVALVNTPVNRWPTFAVYFVFLTALVILSRLPLAYVLKRSLVIIPFVALAAVSLLFVTAGQPIASFNIGNLSLSVSDTGLDAFFNILAKSWLAIISLIVFTATTRWTDLMHGLMRLKVPRVMTMMLSFMYRYVFVIEDEFRRMRQARDARYFDGNRYRAIRTVGHMIGTLFVRSYERGERIYGAMLARGYQGRAVTLESLSFRPADAVFSAVSILVLVVAMWLAYSDRVWGS